MTAIVWVGAILRFTFGSWSLFRTFRSIRSSERGRILERALGFRHASFHVPRDESQPYVKVVVKSVAPGAEFQRAGFRSGDVLPDVAGSIPGLPSAALYQFLDRNRGVAVTLAAINISDLNDDRRDFEEMPRRNLTFTIPSPDF
jgi:hypothetical protein